MPDACSPCVPPVPILRLLSALTYVQYLDRAGEEERELPLARLDFDYAGARIAASEPRQRLVVAGATLERDPAAEAQARQVLESLGATELACTEELEPPPGCDADYLISLDEEPHAACAFSAYAVPQLRERGWRVEIDPGYRFQVVDQAATPWYAELQPDEQADWFNLELGVEAGGQRVNLLPALLGLLQESASLGALRLRRRCVALPLDGHYVTLSAERLRFVAKVLLELYDRARPASLRVPALRADLLNRLDHAFTGDVDAPQDALDALDTQDAQDAQDKTPGAALLGGGLRWHGGRAALDRARVLAAPPTQVAAPAALRARLRPYQQEGLNWLQHLRTHEVGGILADDMGLGKTLQAAAHLLLEHTAGRADAPSLVVAPTSLMGNWQRELRRFAPSLWVTVYHGARRRRCWGLACKSDVVVTSYPILSRDVERFADQRYHLLVLDEAQTVKNSLSQVHRAVRRVEARQRLCLTGTPLENHLGELWALFETVMPGTLGDRQRFGERFRVPIERDGDAERLRVLRERVAPFILRRTKEQVAKELPRKTELVRAVELRGAQRELYESIRVAAHARVRQAIAERGISRSTVAILDALLKLRQVCCDPRLVKLAAARGVAESAKFELLCKLLPQLLAQGRRVLLFSQFTSMLALISEELQARAIRHVALTGSTAQRQRPIDAFSAGEVDVMLISLKAGGTGLNLTRADTVIHYDPWWNPAAQAQATDRAHRIGQRRPVFVYNLITAGSVEERMLQLQRRKLALSESLLQGSAGLELSPREVESLFRPLDDEPEPRRREHAAEGGPPALSAAVSGGQRDGGDG